ncbi:peptidase S24-like protein [Pseudaminobacter salicylatoxidans]|uniref:Peptidase S24-like protein n=1 Tax=Pseudaminobacter salicylatoxidans TaxID=93369 RepID=A0A316BR46_PSESE|nr:XRE family transcriptional regulator [Pseudaminobacter salicylatoxidans]PWJ73850.1 peptidase S24-like protein [Pseudaminobacter salicylatoxidans]
MSTPGERLRKARIDAGYRSAAAGAEAAGVPTPTMYHHENGTRTISSRAAERYASAFKVTASWLMFGEKTRISLDEEWEEDVRRNVGEQVAYSRENYRPTIDGAIPEIDVELGAGQGRIGEFLTLPVGDETYSGHRVVDEWFLPESYFDRVLDARSGNTLVMPVVGDSMAPTYNPGDRVLVDLSQGILTTDTVYVISDGYSPPQIKRLQRVLFSQPPEVQVLSDNPSHAPQRVALNDLHIIGRVVGAISKR